MTKPLFRIECFATVMKLRLLRGQPIGAGLVRLAAVLTGDAAESLAGVTEHPGKSVHQARVALKRARSLLRLLEKAGAAWAVPPRFRLRLLAHRMSAARERVVLVARANAWARRLKGKERAVALTLAKRRPRFVPLGVDEIRNDLLREAGEWVVAPAPVVSRGDLRNLFRRSLDRVMRRYREAKGRPTPATVHEWRKAVIVLRDQTAIASEIWPGGAGVAFPMLVRFARELGARGDVALLLRAVRGVGVPSTHERARRVLVGRLEKQLKLATVTLMARWPRIELRLARALAKKSF